MEALVDAYLLESPAPDQYGFHDLPRVYAAERAEAEEKAGDRDGALCRLLEWYLDSIDAAAMKVAPHRHRAPVPEPSRELCPSTFATSDTALDWLESEGQNIIATRDPEMAIQYMEQAPDIVRRESDRKGSWIHIAQSPGCPREAHALFRALGDETQAAVARADLSSIPPE